MNGILEQLRTYYQALQPGQQRILVAALIMALVAVVGVASWSAQDHTKPLLTTSDPGEVQAVAGALDADGIAYKVSGDGRTISVAPADEGRARVSSARAGQIVGLELLDSVELGTSPKREQWAYQRGLQGELEQTISSLDGVSWAKVHVVMPERSPFLRDEQAASASVTVGLVPGGTLSKRERLGITALVAGAVEGLRADNVALIDQEGTLLSGGGADDSLAGQASLFEIQLSNEARTRAAIEDALFRVLGNRAAMSVAVTVDLETKATDKLERRVVADESALVSESIREENTQSSRPTGVPGAQSNIPEQGGPNAEAQTQNSTITDSRNNYEPTRVEERETRAPGTISRVSVAVTVNKNTVAELAKKALVASGVEEPDATLLQEREAELQKQIEQTVRVAMGFDATRKDSLAVEFLPFSQSLDAEAELLEGSDSFFDESVLVWSLLLVSIVLFFSIVIRPLVGAVAKAALPPLPPAIEPAAADAAMALTDGRTGPNGGLGVDGLSMDDPAAREAGRNLTERLRSMVDNFENVDAADLNRLVDLEREATAQVLHRWIREG